MNFSFFMLDKFHNREMITFGCTETAKRITKKKTWYFFKASISFGVVVVW